MHEQSLVDSVMNEMTESRLNTADWFQQALLQTQITV